MRQARRRSWWWDRATQQRARLLLGTVVASIALAALVAMSGCALISGRSGMSSGTATTTAVLPTATTGTPTPTPTAAEQRLDALVQPAIGPLAYNVSVRYDPASNSPFVTATVSPGPDVPTTQKLVKTVCFLAFKALWTSGEAFKDVSVAVLGPFQDDWGDHVLQAYGSADVTAQTAAKLRWASLTPETAWNAYTNVFLAPSYAAGQYWGLPTPTPFGAIKTHSRLTV
jgi:hypothetical protein